MTHALLTCAALCALPYLLTLICREFAAAYRAAFGA